MPGKGDNGLSHRTIPIEVLREFARSEAELSSIRFAAKDAGVGRSSLHQFITAGTMPHPGMRSLLTSWYLRRLEALDETELLRPYVSALASLLDGVPESTIGRARLSVLESVEQCYPAVGEETPRWVHVLRARLSRDE